MASTTDDLPGEMIVPTRSDILSRFIRDWKIRQNLQDPTRPVDVGPKTLPYLLGTLIADAFLPVMSNVLAIGRATLLRNARGTRLDALAEAQGTSRLEATSSTGYVTVLTSTAGGQIQEDDELEQELTGNRFRVLKTDLYTNGTQVPVEALDTGPETNLDAETVLIFTNPRQGINPKATVATQSDGSGLTGGHEAETDEQLIERIISLRTNPPASGNAAEIVAEMEKAGTGVPVEKAFVIPAWAGPGTACVCFTVRPTATGSRIPNDVQMGIMQGVVEATFPGDDSFTVAFLLPQLVTIQLKVTWKKGAPGWADQTPWPPYQGAFSTAVTDVGGTVPPTSSTCRVVTSIPLTVAPQIGQTIAFYDLVTKTFARKKILDVTEVAAGLSWDLEFDLSNNASDPFVPVSGQFVSPWSDSLNFLPAPVTTFMGTLGPGEQFASFPDPGQRQKRQPESPVVWSSVLRNADFIGAVKTASVISDVDLARPTTPYATNVGVPGVSVNLLQMNDLAVYQQ